MRPFLPAKSVVFVLRGFSVSPWFKGSKRFTPSSFFPFFFFFSVILAVLPLLETCHSKLHLCHATVTQVLFGPTSTYQPWARSITSFYVTLNPLVCRNNFVALKLAAKFVALCILGVDNAGLEITKWSILLVPLNDFFKCRHSESCGPFSGECLFVIIGHT